MAMLATVEELHVVEQAVDDDIAEAVTGNPPSNADAASEGMHPLHTLVAYWAGKEAGPDVMLKEDGVKALSNPTLAGTLLPDYLKQLNRRGPCYDCEGYCHQPSDKLAKWRRPKCKPLGANPKNKHAVIDRGNELNWCLKYPDGKA